MFGWIAVNYLKGKHCTGCAHLPNQDILCCPWMSLQPAQGTSADTAQA